jgi:hypothetical protein
VISPTQRPLHDNTQHSQQKGNHATGGNRTRIPRKRATAEPRLRPLGHRDRRNYVILPKNMQKNKDKTRATWRFKFLRQWRLFSVVPEPNSGLGRLIVEVPRSYTHTHMVGHLWTSDQVVAEAANFTTHNKHKRTNIHILSGILTRIPKNQTAANLRHSPHGHRHRPRPAYWYIFTDVSKDPTAFIFRVQQSKKRLFLGCLTLKMKALWTF